MFCRWIRMRSLAASVYLKTSKDFYKAHCIIFSSFFIFFAFNSSAFASSLEVSGWLAASLTDFHFTEFDANGGKLLTEKGYLPGIQAGMEFKWKRWFMNGETSVIKGRADYDGQTNTGNSLLTITDEEIVDASFKGGFWLAQFEHWQYAVFGGIGHRWWWRDIRSVASVNGLSEAYTSWYGILGCRYNYSLSKRWTVAVNAQAIRPFSPDVEVSLYRRDNVTLRLQEETGFSASASLRWQWTESIQIELKPYYSFWKFGRSEIKPITWHDVRVGTVYEPDSEMRNSGVQLGLVYMFQI